MTADLNTALAFVIQRVEQQATRSGDPLNRDEQHLLRHLPRRPRVSTWYDPENPTFQVRDQLHELYEKLCALAKDAHVHDLRVDPALAADWEFSAAVSRLHKHPMAWLLWWAGLRKRKPWWDKWVLLGVSLVFVICGISPVLFQLQKRWAAFQWVVFGSTYAAIFFLAYLLSRWSENRQFKQDIEKCRHASQSSGLTLSKPDH